MCRYKTGMRLVSARVRNYLSLLSSHLLSTISYVLFAWPTKPFPSLHETPQGTPPPYNHTIKLTTQHSTFPPTDTCRQPRYPYLGYRYLSCPLSPPPRGISVHLIGIIPLTPLPPPRVVGTWESLQRGEGRGTKTGTISSLVCTDQKRSVKAGTLAAPPPSLGASMAMVA
jgi:hypothetical protein